MHSQAKASRVKLPEVHSVDKGVDPNIKPGRQILKPPNLTTPLNPLGKPRLGQVRAGPRQKTNVPTQVQMQVPSKHVSQTR